MDIALFPIVSTLHTLATVVWVGGMFFAHFVLRPSLMPMDPPVRLELWSRVFPKFFAWVWLSIVVLIATGYAMVFQDFGSFENAGFHVTIMHGVAWLMAIMFLYMFFVPFARFKGAVKDQDWPGAAKALIGIRHVVTTNLGLGLLEVVIGVSGRFWG